MREQQNNNADYQQFIFSAKELFYRCLNKGKNKKNDETLNTYFPNCFWMYASRLFISKVTDKDGAFKNEYAVYVRQSAATPNTG